MEELNVLEGLRKATWIAENLPILFFGDPVLKTVCKSFKENEYGTKEIYDLAEKLVETIKAYRMYMGMGRGIAANQIGSDKRMIVVWLIDEPEVFVNPEIVTLSGEGSYWESCMSSGNLIIGEVVRAWTGTFRYKDLTGKEHLIDADEKQTRLLLHEIDHLNGNICIEQYTKGTTKFITGGKEEVLGYKFKKLK